MNKRTISRQDSTDPDGVALLGDCPVCEGWGTLSGTFFSYESDACGPCGGTGWLPQGGQR